MSKMQVEIKKTVKSGNSSAVILPKAWLNMEVRVELVKKTPEKILSEVIEIAGKHINLEKIIGVYLVGSYARGEESEESDIDVLIITDDIDKELIKEGVYSMMVVSKQLLNQKLENDILPVGQMIKEAKTLINSNYIESLDVKITKKNTRGYIDTTKEKLNLIDDLLKKTKDRIDNRIIYTLVLRIRTLYITEKLIKNQAYSNKEFIKLITKISGSKDSYNSYLAVKNDLHGKNLASKKEAEKLHNYLKKQLDKIKKGFES